MEKMTYALDYSVLAERGSCALFYHLDAEMLLISMEDMRKVYDLSNYDQMVERHDLVCFLNRLFDYESADDIPLDELLLVDGGRKLVVTSKTLHETDRNYTDHGRSLTIVCGHDEHGKPALNQRDYLSSVEVADTVPMWPGVILTDNLLAPDLEVCVNKYGLAPVSMILFEPEDKATSERQFAALDTRQDGPLPILLCRSSDTWRAAVEIYVQMTTETVFIGVSSEGNRAQAIKVVRSTFKRIQQDFGGEKGLSELDTEEETYQACAKSLLGLMGQMLGVNDDSSIGSWVLLTHAETLSFEALTNLVSLSSQTEIHRVIFVYRIGSKKQLIRQMARNLTMLGDAGAVDDTWLNRQEPDRLRL